MGGSPGQIDWTLAFQLRHVVPVEAYPLRNRVHGILLRCRVRKGVQACGALERSQDGALAADLQAEPMGVGETLGGSDMHTLTSAYFSSTPLNLRLIHVRSISHCVYDILPSS